MWRCRHICTELEKKGFNSIFYSFLFQAIWMFEEQLHQHQLYFVQIRIICICVGLHNYSHNNMPTVITESDNSYNILHDDL